MSSLRNVYSCRSKFEQNRILIAAFEPHRITIVLHCSTVNYELKIYLRHFQKICSFVLVAYKIIGIILTLLAVFVLDIFMLKSVLRLLQMSFN